KLNGHPKKRLPNNAHFSFKNVKGEPLIFLLDSKGVAASTGSACSSKKLEPSHVLLEIGLEEEDAQSSLRLTLGKENTKEDIDFAINTINESVEKLRTPVTISGMTEIVPINRYGPGLAELDDEIVVDEEVNLIINEKFSRSFSISPNSLKEFATGYLLGEGLISSVDNINRIEIEGLDIKVNIDLADFDIKDLVVGSDCFGGWRRKIEVINRVESEFSVSKKDLFKSFEQLKEKAKVWQNTGGAHVAGLVYNDKFISREDVSRHVAADKVIGAAALENIDFGKSFMVYSGRMPADMMIKLARVGIPIIASNAAPTSSGYAVAFKAGITMIGFLRGERFNVYSRLDRILFD
ncbi:MAG: formate dehydrogenase accessory sulfurtransferase FdhD, partial [Methanobacteriaceae archaeon]|nr:formate dehydrogenase accessory sulfurtransferase FdhD [Methanobacteriaceae archaeon]